MSQSSVVLFISLILVSMANTMQQTKNKCTYMHYKINKTIWNLNDLFVLIIFIVYLLNHSSLSLVYPTHC